MIGIVCDCECSNEVVNSEIPRDVGRKGRNRAKETGGHESLVKEHL